MYVLKSTFFECLHIIKSYKHIANRSRNTYLCLCELRSYEIKVTGNKKFKHSLNFTYLLKNKNI